MSSFRRRLMVAQGGGEQIQDYCVYTTTNANQSVKIIDQKQYAQRIYLQDGTELDVSGTGELNYTFSDAGEHKVWIEFKEDVYSFYSCFWNCLNLTSISENLFVKNSVATSFASCFSYCTGLISIPERLFANNTNVTDFSSCFQRCSNITSSCPIDNDGTPIYNRSNGKEGYEKVIYPSACFNGCTKMKDYNSIPLLWVM